MFKFRNLNRIKFIEIIEAVGASSSGQECLNLRPEKMNSKTMKFSV